MPEYIYNCMENIIKVFAFKLMLNQVESVHLPTAHTTHYNQVTLALWLMSNGTVFHETDESHE